MTKPKRKSKRKPEGLANLRKAARKYLAHPPSHPDRPDFNAKLEASQIQKLKQLAREHRTTVAEEIYNAIDAYLLDLSPADIRLLNAILDHFNATVGKNHKAVEAALRAIGKSNARLARLEQAPRRRPP